MNGDGGPAFPVSDAYSANKGMSLRDYFAIRFAAELVATPESCALLSKHAMQDGMRPADLMALVAYDLADAMLRRSGQQ